jgi:hypothetical protein
MPITTYRSRTRRHPRRPLSQVPMGKVHPKVTRPTLARSEVPAFDLCPSCDRAITPTGQCGC